MIKIEYKKEIVICKSDEVTPKFLDYLETLGYSFQIFKQDDIFYFEKTKKTYKKNNNI